MLRRRWVPVAGAVVLSAALAASLLAFRLARGPANASPLGSLDVVTRLDFRCTLPVELEGRLATVSLPDGAVTRASASTGPHDQGESFSAGHWLPVLPSAVSPDGGSYAYVASITGAPGAATGTVTLFARDVRTGRTRPLWSGQGQALLMSWTREGVYLSRDYRDAGTGEFHTLELWLVDPGGRQAARAIGPRPALVPPPGSALFPMFDHVDHGAAWAVTASTPPPPPGGSVLNDELLRMDLRGGGVTTWLRVPGRNVQLFGVDPAGRPVIGLAGPALTVGGTAYPAPVDAMALVTGRDEMAPIPMPDPGMQPSLSLTDAHGTWLEAPGALWLYRAGRLVEVATIPASVAPPGRRYAAPPGTPAYRTGAVMIPLGPCA